MSCTPGVEQKRPHFMPGVLKLDFYVAMIISHVKAIWKPAAAATPLTEQSVIIGKFFNKNIVFVN